MLMPHHLLHPRRVGIIGEGNGRSGMAETMHQNAGFLYPHQE
jgi:hypothetical protein